MKTLLLTLGLALCTTQSHAIEPVRIEVGSDYSKYSNEELRRRVWQLERAVSQLQDQVFQLALHGNSGNSGNGGDAGMWTCQIQSFGKTHVAAGITRTSALAQVLKKCSDATNAIHCREADVKCGND